jgi:hypothetical protein
MTTPKRRICTECLSHPVAGPGEVRCKGCQPATSSRSRKPPTRLSELTDDQLRAAGVDPTEAAYLNS